MIPLDEDEEEAGESVRAEEGLRYWESNSSVTIAQLAAAVQQDRTDETSWLQLALLQPGRTAALQVLLARILWWLMSLLQVLAQALEALPASVQLWALYLHSFAQRPAGVDGELIELCRTAVCNVDSFWLWCWLTAQEPRIPDRMRLLLEAAEALCGPPGGEGLPS